MFSTNRFFTILLMVFSFVFLVSCDSNSANKNVVSDNGMLSGDDKYLDPKVIKNKVGDKIDSLTAKLDHNFPYSFEVDDAIDGGVHGNTQCKVPAAFTEVHKSVEKNYTSDDYVAYGFGTPISEDALKVWNIDVDGNGKGLPDPSVGMTVGQGAEVYAAFCAMCHGEFGEGAKGYLALAGDEELVASSFDDPAPIKTFGNYWPYAVTMFDYIRRTMPFWTPNMSAIGDAGYLGITGYLVQSNYIPIDINGTELEDDTFFNSELLMKVNKFMGNQSNFFCDRRPVVHNERCMENCPDYMVGDGKGDTSKYKQARRLPDGTPQYNVEQRLHETLPGVGHQGF